MIHAVYIGENKALMTGQQDGLVKLNEHLVTAVYKDTHFYYGAFLWLWRKDWAIQPAKACLYHFIATILNEAGFNKHDAPVWDTSYTLSAQPWHTTIDLLVDGI